MMKMSDCWNKYCFAPVEKLIETLMEATRPVVTEEIEVE